MMTIADFQAEVAEVVRFLHAQGWTPATSSNFSCRVNAEAPVFSISVSGLDKALFSAADFLEVDFEGQPTASKGSDERPSAEVLLHRTVYRLYPQACTVLHTHSVNGAVLSLLYEREGGLTIRGFEVMKAFEGLRSHEESLWLPIFPNSQDMTALSADVEQALASRPGGAPGFLLAGHGLYAWGETPAQAKRHIEAFEYLFDCLLKLRSYGHIISL